MFDISTNKWTFIQSMNNARSGVSLVAHKKCLYALGGFNGYSRLNTGENSMYLNVSWRSRTQFKLMQSFNMSLILKR